MKNQVSITLSAEDREKAYQLAKRLKLMNPKHPNEPSISLLLRTLVDEKLKALDRK